METSASFLLVRSLQRTRPLSYVILVSFLLTSYAPFATAELAFLFHLFLFAEGRIPCLAGWMSYSVTRSFPSLRTGHVSLLITQ